MTDNTQKPERSLVKKLCRILNGIDHIEKNGRNKEQGYDFVRESDVKAELRKLFADENVWPSPDVEDASYVEFPTKSGGVMHFCRLKVRITFEDGDSGETRSCRVMGEAMDSGDKASNKALTAAVKVALLQSMLIPTGDDTENDPKPEPVRQQPKPTAPSIAQVAKMVEAFAALGVTPADVEKRLGHSPATLTLAEYESLKAWGAELKAAKVDPDEAARKEVQKRAEEQLAKEGTKRTTAETTKIMSAFSERIRAAKSEKDIALVLSEVAGAGLSKAEVAGLTRVGKDHTGLLAEAAARAKLPARQPGDDVGF